MAYARARVLSFQLLGVVLAGCGPGSPQDPDSPPNAFRAAFIQAACDEAIRCGIWGGSERTWCVHDYPRYVAGELTFPFGLPWGAGDLVAAGRVTFDASAADDCLAFARSFTCDGRQARATRCRQVFRGQILPGQLCRTDLECAGGFCDTYASCNGSPCTPDPCQWRCKAYPAIGAPCHITSTPFTLCDPATSWCSDGTCVALGRLGEPCQYHFNCESGLLCHADSAALDGGVGDGGVPAAAKRCVEPIPEGGPCIADDQVRCAPGFACDPGSMTCKPRLQSGQHCDNSTQCAPGLTCARGSCGPWLDQGVACGTGPTQQEVNYGCPSSQLCGDISGCSSWRHDGCRGRGPETCPPPPSTYSSGCGDKPWCPLGLGCDQGACKVTCG